MGLTHPITSKGLERYGSSHYKVGVVSMQGYRAEMEDRHRVVLSHDRWPSLDVGFFGVYDGHGGDRAAAYVSSELHTHIYHYIKPYNFHNLSPEQLGQIVGLVDRELIDAEAMQREEGTPELSFGGTTANFAIVVPESKSKYRVTVGNVGDSRCIVGHKGRFTCMSRDHKPDDPNEKLRVQRAGGYVKDSRIDGDLAVSRTLGDSRHKAVSSTGQRSQVIIPTPEFSSCTLEHGDWIFIACDGVWDVLTNEEISNFIWTKLREKKDGPAEIASLLLDEALSEGSKDNMSCILVLLADGQSYDGDNEFVPGPYQDYGNGFAEAYRSNALRHGVSFEVAMEKRRRLERCETTDRKNGQARPRLRAKLRAGSVRSRVRMASSRSNLNGGGTSSGGPAPFERIESIDENEMVSIEEADRRETKARGESDSAPTTPTSPTTPNIPTMTTIQAASTGREAPSGSDPRRRVIMAELPCPPGTVAA